MIKINYLAHSSVEIVCGATTLITDPWWIGPAYSNQWYLWPLPVINLFKQNPDAVLISHGHEDHLHRPTLENISKSSKVFFPFQWRAGIKEYLNYIGFKNVVEAVSFKKYFVNDVKITFIGFALESAIIIEYNNEVLVNINDALNSNHENATNFILNEINSKWPSINYLLSGWSGASYFPNQIKYKNKDDVLIGKLREQYFANNLCRFTQILKPKFTFPFAAGFVLLKESTKWINHVKFPRTQLKDYYATHYDLNSSTDFLIAYPGDTIENGLLSKHSYLHNIQEEKQYDLAYKHYNSEIQQSRKIETCTDEEIMEQLKVLVFWMNKNKKIYHEKVQSDVFFTIVLEERSENYYINVYQKNLEIFAEISAEIQIESRLLIKLSLKNLKYSLSKLWGGDVLTIGYGIEVYVFDELTLEKNLDIVCVRLLTRYPIARKEIIKNPIRILKFYSYNPSLTNLWIDQKFKLKPYINKYPFNERDHWLTYNKCDLCAVCKMPEINVNAY